MSNVAERIKAYNSGRIPRMLKIKYNAMYEDKYRFYRAIPHVLYEDMPENSFLRNSPHVWLCGDLHLENLGSYKGDNRVTYFGVNDFDECLLGPLLIDIDRMLGSVLISSDNLKMKAPEAERLCYAFIDTYFGKLAEGYIRALETETTRGVMRKFLEKIQSRKRRDFLKKRTEKNKGTRKLIIDGEHTLEIPKAEKEKVTQHIFNWAKSTNDPEFYEVLDIAFRIAGTSSLGLNRYAVLVRGRGGDDGYFLLDLKETLPSCLAKHIRASQPKWKTEAERIVEVQKRTLSAPPALLASINIDKKNFVLKELQPSADRIDYAIFRNDTKKLKNILEDLACICAWSNLRSSGRDDSAIADELIDFARTQKLRKELLDNAKGVRDVTVGYHKEFCKAYEKGFFKV